METTVVDVPEASLTDEQLLEMQRRLLRIRLFDGRAVELQSQVMTGTIRVTGRVVVVDPAPLTCRGGSELAATIAEERFWHLKAAPIRVAAPDVPFPFSPPLERRVMVDADDVTQAVRRAVAELARNA